MQAQVRVFFGCHSLTLLLAVRRDLTSLLPALNFRLGRIFDLMTELNALKQKFTVSVGTTDDDCAADSKQSAKKPIVWCVQL